MAGMEKFLAHCYALNNEQLTSGIRLIQVPSAGDYMTLPGRDQVLKVEYLEWQVRRDGDLVTVVHIYGDIVPPPYRI